MSGRGRPRLLFLSQTLPYPPDGGVAIRTYNVLRQLAEAFDVTALCFFRRRFTRDVAASIEALSRFAAVEAFPIPEEHSRRRLVRNHLTSVATSQVYTRFTYESAVFRTRLDELLRQYRFHLAHLDSLDLSAYLPALAGLPTVCVHHNVESALLRRRAEVEQESARRWYLRYQAGLMRREERRWAPRATLNVTMSEVDRRLLESIAPGAKVTVVPNGVDVEQFRPAEAIAPSDGGLVFVGGTTWFPNRDALEFFASEILPCLRQVTGPVPVKWVGRAAEQEQREYAKVGIELTGYVDDIRPHVGGAACFIVPLRVGGGTRLKILDAWALGKAVVSTSVGCEGLAAVDGENILIRDSPEEFAAGVTDVLRDSALRERLGVGARATVERLYSWDGIGAVMREDYLRAAGLGPAATTPTGAAGLVP